MDPFFITLLIIAAMVTVFCLIGKKKDVKLPDLLEDKPVVLETVKDDTVHQMVAAEQPEAVLASEVKPAKKIVKKVASSTAEKTAPAKKKVAKVKTKGVK